MRPIHRTVATFGLLLGLAACAQGEPQPGAAAPAEPAGQIAGS